MSDSYVYAIMALLPLAAGLLVFQTNPYHALVIRGILGAIAALIYATLGAADLALTEALVGTMLAITLYAVAVRSSLVMRLGVLESALEETQLAQLTAALRLALSPYHVRLELVSYDSQASLHEALTAAQLHAVCTEQSAIAATQSPPGYLTEVRLQRLYEILQTKQVSQLSRLRLVGQSATSADRLIKAAQPDGRES
ncbi:MAG: DUF4040 domain-containing protein [Leptolyngbya sp. SIO4C1]|nr:DUF4040 domain-containing protein [Leptolyngbya sp. SIO4C1]